MIEAACSVSIPKVWRQNTHTRYSFPYKHLCCFKAGCAVAALPAAHSKAAFAAVRIAVVHYQTDSILYIWCEVFPIRTICFHCIGHYLISVVGLCSCVYSCVRVDTQIAVRLIVRVYYPKILRMCELCVLRKACSCRTDSVHISYRCR